MRRALCTIPWLPDIMGWPQTMSQSLNSAIPSCRGTTWESLGRTQMKKTFQDGWELVDTRFLLGIFQTQSASGMAGIHLWDNSGWGTENAQADLIRKMILTGSRGPSGAGHTLRTQQGKCLHLSLSRSLSCLPLLIFLSPFWEKVSWITFCGMITLTNTNTTSKSNYQKIMFFWSCRSRERIHEGNRQAWSQEQEAEVSFLYPYMCILYPSEWPRRGTWYELSKYAKAPSYILPPTRILILKVS